MLDLRVQAVYGKIGGFYELLVDFGTTQTGYVGGIEGYEYTASGYAVHTLSVDYAATYDAEEKLQFKAKPKLTMNLYTKNDTSEWNYKDQPDSDEGETDDGTQTAFRLTPAVDLGVSWKLLPKLTLYTGTTVTPFVLTTYETKEGDKNSSVKDEKKSYLEGAAVTTLYAGLEFNPTSFLGFEFGLSNIYLKPSDGTFSADITNYSGRFAVKVKL